VAEGVCCFSLKTLAKVGSMAIACVVLFRIGEVSSLPRERGVAGDGRKDCVFRVEGVVGE
jgi:hypothetical protein